MELCHYILKCVAFCVSFDGYMYTEKSVVDLFGLNCLYCVIQYIWIHAQKFWISVNAEVQNFCVSFDGYMYTEKSVVDLFGLNCLYCVIQYIWIYAQKFWISVNAEVQNFCVSFDGYMYTEKSVVDLFGLNCLYCVIQYIWIHAQKFWISVNAEVQNFCVSFDGYMYTEKSVNYLERESFTCTRKCRSTRERNIKDTSDGLRVDVWIMVMHCTYGDGYRLCRFLYFELYIGMDIMLRHHKYCG